MSRKVKLVISAALLAGIVLFVTYILLQSEKRELENLIITYNNMLMRAHSELKVSIMENLTSERELSRIDNYMAYLLKNHRSLIGEIKDIKFLEVRAARSSAVVTTTERWVYFYIDPATKQPVSETYDVLYGNTYSLKKMRGHWVVDDLESKEIGGKTEG